MLTKREPYIPLLIAVPTIDMEALAVTNISIIPISTLKPLRKMTNIINP